jgi:hypothetical protein
MGVFTVVGLLLLVRVEFMVVTTVAQVSFVCGALAAYKLTYRSMISWAVSSGSLSGSCCGCSIGFITSFPFAVCGYITFGAACCGLLADGLSASVSTI